ncbi:MAG: type VI secretion system tube protein Hcp [Candidatus Hodarchaeales archaeon]|jgi:type VI protein secretion system component Hcp
MRKIKEKNKIFSILLVLVVSLTLSFIGLNTILTDAETSETDQSSSTTTLYMYINGISGTATFQSERNSIPLTSITYGAGRETAFRVGGGSGSSANIQFTEIFVSKIGGDTATPDLIDNLVRGRALSEVEFRFYEDISGTLTKVLTITIKVVVITSFVQSSVEGLGEESFSFSFQKIEWEYHVSQDSASWDLVQNTP